MHPRDAIEPELGSFKAALIAIGHTAQAALARRVQPTSQMASLHDLRYERDLLRAALQAISDMVRKGAEMNDCLSMWVVYDHPRDYPDHYVARQFLIRTGTKTASVVATASIVQSDSLEIIREMMLDQMGKVNIGRYEDDDPYIVEVWV